MELCLKAPRFPADLNVQWSLQFDWPVEDPSDTIRTLSWGVDEELLVGSSVLSVYSTNGSAQELVWQSQLSSPVKFANFSYDASLIASTGVYDRIGKIW